MIKRLVTSLLTIALLGSTGLAAQARDSANPAASAADELRRSVLESLSGGVPRPVRLEELEEVALDGYGARPQGAEAGAVNLALRELEKLPVQAMTSAGVIDAYDRLFAADLLLRARFDQIEARLGQASAPAKVVSRFEAARAEYVAGMDAILMPIARPVEELRANLADSDSELSPVDVDAALADAVRGLELARGLLEEATRETPPPTLRASLLPYRQTRLAPRPPVAGPPIVPSYDNEAEIVATAEDLAAGRQTPLSAPILLKAQELGYDYVRIFEFVSNQIDTEWYAGAMKGAVETLSQSSGNDVDQASLLIALLRASGVPARYVRGVARLPLEELADDFGLTPELVPAALTRAGVPHRPVIQGGVVAAADVELTWVAAQVPYSNYRGAVVDFSGPTWIPLAPALKSYDNQASARVVEQIAGFSASALVADYLSSLQTEDPLEVLRGRVLEHLVAEGLEPEIEALLGDRTLIPRELGLLPSTLPFEVVTVVSEAPSLAAELIHTARFLVYGSSEPDAPVLLDAELDVAELANRRVTLSYLPATVDDHRTVNTFGGLALTPLYLIELRPQVKIDGRPVAVGQVALAAGTPHRMEIVVATPFGEERVESDLISGSYYALGFGAQRSLVRPDSGEESFDTESRAARILSRLVRLYGEEWDAAEAELSGLLDAALVRPFPSVVVAANAVSVEAVLGLPEQLRWEGVTLDAALRVTEPIGRAGGAAGDVAAGELIALSGLQGSALEHFVFERDFLVDGISADKVLGLARDAGMDVLLLDSSNIDAELPGLAHPQAVLDEIESWARRGFGVEAPRGEIARSDWIGSAWRVIDPAGHGAGYFLSGGLAGGSTAETPAAWVLDFLAEALAAAYAGQPNDDPLSGVEVIKLAFGDGQEVEAGEIASRSLEVAVRDIFGNAVKDAPVTFFVDTGGGKVKSGTMEAAIVTVETNALGIASVQLRVGTDTSADPYFIRPNPTDEFATRVSANLIEVEVASHLGPLVLDAPFLATTVPGPPTGVRRLDSNIIYFIKFFQGTVADQMFIAVEDAFGNPVPNVEVRFESKNTTIGQASECAFVPNPLPRLTIQDLRTQLEDCGEGQFIQSGVCGELVTTIRTASSGLIAQMILGNLPGAVYGVDVSVPDVLDITEILTFHYEVPLRFRFGGAEHCSQGQNLLIVSRRIPGGNVARIGEESLHPVEWQVLQWWDKNDPADEEGCLLNPGSNPLLVGEWVPTYHSAQIDGVGGFYAYGGFDIGATNGGQVAEPEFVYTGDPNLPVEGLFLDEAVFDYYPTLVDPNPEIGFFARCVLEPPAEGFFRSYVTAGSTPGENIIFTEADVSIGRGGVPREPVRWNGPPRTDFCQLKAWCAGLFFPRDVGVVEGVDPYITAVVPDQLILTDIGTVDSEVRIEYQVDLPSYTSGLTDIALLEDGEPIGYAVGSSRQGSGFATIQRGFVFDPEKEYEVQLVLNRGRGNQVVSDPAVLPIFQRTIIEYEDPFALTQEVDFLTQRACGVGQDFNFELAHGAAVTLKFKEILDYNGDFVYGADLTILDAQLFDEGLHAIPLTLDTVPPGDYEFTLSTISEADGHTEEKKGIVRAEYVTRDSLPVGHLRVKDVNVHTGFVQLSRRDFQLPGRGVPLSFQRNYSSSDPTELGSLGAGWSHNWESRAVVTPCGEIIIVGGEGSGLRFGPDGSGGFIALNGSHGSLILEPEDFSFEFYSKDGTLYQYRTVFENSFFLDSITDTNGNETSLEYQRPGLGKPRLLSVTDAGGRALVFTYERGEFVFYAGDVITEIAAPGHSLTFDYDAFGNLAVAGRGDGLQSESYAYALPPAFDLQLRHAIIATTNNINGATTTYQVTREVIRANADIVAPTTFYESVSLPAGGGASFAYDYAGLLGRGNPTLITTVTDVRGGATVYTMNQFGNPLSIVDPIGNSQSMTWDSDESLMESSTDANGVVTTFTHDAFGNVVNETVTGAGGSVSTVMTYFAPGSFRPPYVKNRVATRTDRKGTTTSFSYDGAGNRLSEETAGLTTGHTYLSGGDRALTTDARGKRTRFDYDVYGNLAEVQDPAGGVTTMEYDVRSLLTASTDALYRTTSFDYDGLGRVGRKTLPQVPTDSVLPTEDVDYLDADNKIVSRDLLGRATTTTYDLEGRVLEIRNPEGSIKSFTYDLDGNKLTETDWLGKPTSFTYDAAGRLEQRDEPLGRTTVYTYDGVGNILTETLSGGSLTPRLTTHVYDFLNRRVSSTRSAASGDATTLAGYDGEGNRISETDPEGRLTEADYDDFNRQAEVREPENKVTQFDYDEVGNLVEERRLGAAAGTQKLTFEYDDLNRLIESVDATEAKTVYGYDPVGNLTFRIDPQLNLVTQEYDQRDRLISSTVELSSERSVITGFEYDAVGNLTREFEPNDNIIVSTYDDFNRLLRSDDELGDLVENTYDGSGNLKTTRDANGNTSTFTYDELNRLVQADLPENRQLLFTYDVAGNRLTETDPRSKTTEFTYDELDRLVEVEDALGETQSFTYDRVGNLLSVTDRRDHTTSLIYDDQSRVTQITDPLLQVQSFTYDAQGNRLTDTDKRGILTEFAYDLENRLLRTTRAGVRLEEVVYDRNGNRRFVTDANEKITGFEYDTRNLPTVESRPLAAITTFTYDDMGDIVNERDPVNRDTVREYDKRRRLIAETNEAGERTEFTYDGNGNRKSILRPELGLWELFYDGADRLERVEDPLDNSTAYSYDRNGNLLGQTDAEDNPVSFEYDDLNRRTARILPGSVREELGYDEEGNLTSLLDPNGQTITWAYDELDRRTLKSYSLPSTPTGDDRVSIATGYDENDNVTAITETYSGATGSRSTNQAYDSFDRVVSITDPEGKELRYQYDAAGSRTHLTDPDGRVTIYAYDALDRPESVGIPGVGATEYGYFKDSRLQRVTYPNGTEERRSYDDAARLSEITTFQATAPIGGFEYQYDENGNRTQQIETHSGVPETTTYGYDAADRLTSVVYPDSTLTYTYDGVGNRLTELTEELQGDPPMPVALSSKTYAYDSRNRLTSIADSVVPANDASYGWDDNGNLLSRTRAGVATTLTYDVRDQAVEVRDNGSLALAALYNWDGLRVGKRPGASGTIRYVYDQRSTLLQTDNAGTTLAKYDYGPDRLLSIGTPAERSFYLFDGLGSVSHLINSAGTVQARYQYDAWGNLRSQTGASASPFTFTGYESDTETGLYYAKARYYDPEVGRFLTRDPLEGEIEDPPSLNRYIYARSNPTVFVDPDGEESVSTALDQALIDAFAEDRRIAAGLIFSAQIGYKLADILSVGFITGHDEARDQLDRGEISGWEYAGRSAAAAGQSAVVIGAGVATGGLGAVAARGIGLGATGTAVLAGATGGVGAQAGTDLLRGEISSASQYGRSLVEGAAGGALFRGAQVLGRTRVGQHLSQTTVREAATSSVTKIKAVVTGEAARNRIRGAATQVTRSARARPSLQAQGSDVVRRRIATNRAQSGGARPGARAPRSVGTRRDVSFDSRVNRFRDPRTGRFVARAAVDPRVANFQIRQSALLRDNVGFNVSAEKVFRKYSTLGLEGTFVTDARAIRDVLGSFRPGPVKVRFSNRPGQVSLSRAVTLARQIGVPPLSLARGFRITRVNNIRSLNPRSPFEVHSKYFLGPGNGLPGGGPELVVNPVPTGGPRVRK